MSNGPKIQGEVSLSTEGAEASLNRVADVGDKMASRLNTSVQKAGEAVDGIGSGANKSAEEFSRAEGRIAQSIQRTTSSMQLLGKTASEKFEFKITEKGLDVSRFAPYLDQLRKVEAAQGRLTVGGQAMAASYGNGMSRNIQNTAFQLQDYIVQVNGGVDSTKALAMQLPQMLVGFGALGAGIGVVAALLPNIAQAFGLAGAKSKTLAEAMSDLDGAVSSTGESVKEFDMNGLYEQFNKASGATRAAILDQLEFRKALIETERLTANKSFGTSLSEVGAYGVFDWRKTTTDLIARDLGVTMKLALELQPEINRLREGTVSVNSVFEQFGVKLLSGNARAIELAKTMAVLSKSERDAASASSAISEAQAKMAKGHVQTKKELAEAERAAKEARKSNESPEAAAYASAMDKLAKVQGEAGASALDLNRSQRTLFDLMTSAEWANMPETWRKTAVEQFESANAAERVAEAQKRINQLMSQTDSGKLAASREDMQLLADAFERGAISEAEYIEAATTQLDKLSEKAKSVKGIETVISNAFSNLGDAVADFALKGKGSFGNMVETMISDLIRLQVQTAATTLFKEAGGMSGISSWLGNFLSSSSSQSAVAADINSAGLGGYHTGGIAGFEPTFIRFGMPSFVGVPRYHAGGIAGDEVPAVLRRGEGVFTEGQMRALGQGGNMIVNITPPDGYQAKAEKRRDGSGNNILDVLFDQIDSRMASNISVGSGSTNAALQQTFGLSRRAGAY